MILFYALETTSYISDIFLQKNSYVSARNKKGC